MGLWNCNQHQLFQINTAGVDFQKAFVEIYFLSNYEALSSDISHVRTFSCQQTPDLGLFKMLIGVAGDALEQMTVQFKFPVAGS